MIMDSHFMRAYLGSYYFTFSLFQIKKIFLKKVIRLTKTRKKIFFGSNVNSTKFYVSNNRIFHFEISSLNDVI